MGTLLIGAAPHRRSFKASAKMQRGRKHTRPTFFWKAAEQPPPRPRRRKRRKGRA